MITGDIVQEKAEITRFHRFEFLSENIVMYIFSLGSKFTYKGTAYNDLPKVRLILKIIMFGKFTGCKDQLEILIRNYGISKVNSLINEDAP